MKGKFFLDTNILLYSFAIDQDEKKIKAKNLIATALDSNLGIISFQVIQEFLNVMSKGKEALMKEKDRELYLEKTLFPLFQIYPSKELYLKTIEIQERWKYSFYDSLIISAALFGNCSTLYSEDLQHDQKIFGLTIKNPF